MLWETEQGRFGKQLDHNIQALNEGDYRWIPWIFCVFTENHGPSKRAAAQALGLVLNRLEFADIIRIDEQMRQTTSMEWYINWHKLKIRSFFTAGMTDVERRAVLIFASFNPNGFIREKAIKMMREYDGTLPYILLRLNDWVTQVRQAASNAFDWRLRRLAEGELLMSLPFIEKLQKSGRGSHIEYTKRFIEKLTSDEHYKELERGLQSENNKARRICINAMLESTPQDVEKILIHLKQEKDPFLRVMIFKSLCALNANMENVARFLLHDKFPSMRILAMQYLYSVHTDSILDIATAFLLDRNASLRSLARNIVSEHVPLFDFRCFYLESLEQRPFSAILGLGETGARTDAQRIAEYLADHRSAIVQSALISLMRLDVQKYKAIVMNKLMDNRGGVVKTAQQLILKYSIQNYESIREIFQSTPYEHTKIKCVTILFSASKWDRLIYMLEALSCEMESVRELAIQLIRRWLFSFNRSYQPIQKQQKENIILLLKRDEEKLSKQLQRELLFAIDT